MEAMTERKPVEHTFESWVDKQIREATERGEFENLAGAGKPIPGAGAPVDENWWIRGYLRRQGVPADGLLPDSLVLRRDRQRLAETVAGDCDSEAEVRAEVAALNRRIAEYLRTPTPPYVPIAPADADRVVAAWRQRRDAEPRARATAHEATAHDGTAAKPGAAAGRPAAVAVTGRAAAAAGPGWWRALRRWFTRR